MTLEASLDAILSRRVPDNGPGVQVVLVSANGVVYEGARGLANPVEDPTEKVTTKHQANLYSVSKFFTACCILKLIEQGKLSPTDKVYNHVPETIRGLVNEECTIEQLVAHAGGASNPLPLTWVHSPDETIDETEILAKVLKQNPFKPKPPWPYHYSNVGYWVLGFVVTTVCEEPNFAQSCQELLFSKESDLYISDRFSPRAPMAYGHVPRWSALALVARFTCPKRIIGPTNRKWMRMEPHLVDGVGYGGLIGSTRSVSAFLQSLLSGAVLDSMEPLFTPLLNHKMTFGLHVRPHRGLRVYHKEGGGAGCHSSIQFRRHAGLAGCIIAGDTTFDVNTLLDELLDCVEDSIKIAPPPPHET
jgi:CubicO group peptidase (beta-lactamase class C family)